MHLFFNIQNAIKRGRRFREYMDRTQFIAKTVSLLSILYNMEDERPENPVEFFAERISPTLRITHYLAELAVEQNLAAKRVRFRSSSFRLSGTFFKRMSL